jgi:hypothetical protein
MTVLWWRIRFALAVSWILREDWWRYKRFYLIFGWQISEYMYLKSDDTPYQSALDEMTRWYTE